MTTDQLARAILTPDAEITEESLAAISVVDVLLPRRQVYLCPTCDGPLRGLLGGCADPDCQSADTKYRVVYERGCDES